MDSVMASLESMEYLENSFMYVHVYICMYMYTHMQLTYYARVYPF